MSRELHRPRAFQWRLFPPKYVPRWSGSPCSPVKPPGRKRQQPATVQNRTHRPRTLACHQPRGLFSRGFRVGAGLPIARDQAAPANLERLVREIKRTNLRQNCRQRSSNRSGNRPAPSRPLNPGQRRRRRGAVLVAIGGQHKKYQPNQRIKVQ